MAALEEAADPPSAEADEKEATAEEPTEEETPEIAEEKKRRIEVENLILIQLSERGVEIWEHLTKISGSDTEKTALLKLLFRYVDNVMNDPSNPKFQLINTSNRHFKEKIMNVDLARTAAVLEIAGFTHSSEDSNYHINPPRTLDELTALSEVWFLVQLVQWFRTLTRADLVSMSKSFSLPDTLGSQMSQFAATAPALFRGYLGDAAASTTVRRKYEYLCKAVHSCADAFFGAEGVEDSFTAWVCAKGIYEKYLKPDESDAATKDTEGVLDEKDEKEEEEKKEGTDGSAGCSSSSSSSSSTDSGSKNGPLSSYVGSESGDGSSPTIVVLDIGMGWGNIGRALHQSFRELSDPSKWKRLRLHGFDISPAMLEMAKSRGYGDMYSSMTVLDCAAEKCLSGFSPMSVDCIVSANCFMQESKIGHPSHLFFIEAIRVLKVHGCVFAAQRKLGIAIGEAEVWKEQALKLHLDENRSGRVRETVYVEWLKILDYTALKPGQ